MMRPVIAPGDERQEGLRQEGSKADGGGRRTPGPTEDPPPLAVTRRARCPVLGPPRGTLTLESPYCQSAFRTGAQESRVCFLILARLTLSPMILPVCA